MKPRPGKDPAGERHRNLRGTTLGLRKPPQSQPALEMLPVCHHDRLLTHLHAVGRRLLTRGGAYRLAQNNRSTRPRQIKVRHVARRVEQLKTEPRQDVEDNHDSEKRLSGDPE